MTLCTPLHAILRSIEWSHASTRSINAIMRRFRSWWGEVAVRLADVRPTSVKKQVSEFLTTRWNILRHVRDAMADN